MALAIVGGRLIDGTGRDPVAKGVVVIEDGSIAAAGPETRVSVPKGAEILDAAGRTVLPGFIDCHVHGTYRARDMRQHLLNSPTYNVLRSTQILAETLACGVTTARDMGGADAGFRVAIDEGLVAGPRLLISLVMLSQTGGHGDSWVPAGYRVPKRAWLPDPVADGTDEVRRKVRHLLMAGADFIKMCTTGGITSVTDSWDEPQFTVAEIAVAVEEAAAKGKRVAVHAEGLAGIKNALAARIYSLEHGWFLDEECVARMTQAGTWWVPTLALVPLSVERRRKDKAWGAQQLGQEDRKDEEIYRKMDGQKELWREAVRRGVRIAMGTDQSHRLLVGENLVELEFMVRFLGMSPMQAISAATARAAECIERPDLGTLEAGKRADVVVCDGDPLADIGVLNERARIHLVMKDGKAYRNVMK
ncbi:MAG: amidohydrolase family protein [Rhodospirillales bacterium]|nr:amidohydrolase family protein [Rhodospirillales bacterium]